MKKEKSFYVVAEYTGYDALTEEDIYNAAGRSDSSGLGFGIRDHEWYDLTKAEAKLKVKRLKAIDGLDVTMNVEYGEKE